MKIFKLNAEPRTELGKKASAKLREENLIPVVLNGGEVVELPYNGTLLAGQKVVELGVLPRSEKKSKRVIDERYE